MHRQTQAAYYCQVGQTRLSSSASPYAEAAHVHPLGASHHGPDILANVLYVKQNCQVMFNYGSFGIADSGELLGLPGRLAVVSRHPLAAPYLAYHYTRFYEPQL